MEETEKMAALKKAYADIILNTAKEAAARIMVSERKTLRVQQELSAAKEGALNMLLRLKQIMDSKIAEAEVASLSQQSRIEELEMQLHEAEDVVTDLRYELKGAHDELEMLKRNPNLLDGKIVMANAIPHEEEAQEDKLNTSEGISCHPPDSECRPMSTCIMENAPLNQSDDKCCSLSENRTAQVETSSNSPMDNYCAGNPDLACIIMRSKEPELYRNGCTQRIRAFEGNLLDGGKLPLPGNEDDPSLHIKSGEKVEGTCSVASPKIDNMTVAEKNISESEVVIRHDSSRDKGPDAKFVRRCSHIRKRYRTRKTTSCRSLPDRNEDDRSLHIKSGEIVEGTCSVASPKIDNMTDAEKNMAESEVVIRHDSSRDKGQDGKFVRRCSHRRRRYRTRKATSCRSLPDPCEPSFHSHNKTYPYLVNGNAESGEDPSKVSEDEAQRDSESHVDSEARNTEAGSPQNVTSKDPALINDTLLIRQESKAVENSEVLDSKFNLDPMAMPSINSDAKDTQTRETTIAAISEATTDRLLKYTFRRKRKKDTMSNPSDNAVLEDINTTKRRTLEKQNSTPEPQKSCLIIESPRDSRRLVQVARQLISLSEKRDENGFEINQEKIEMEEVKKMKMKKAGSAAAFEVKHEELEKALVILGNLRKDTDRIQTVIKKKKQQRKRRCHCSVVVVEEEVHYSSSCNRTSSTSVRGATMEEEDGDGVGDGDRDPGPCLSKEELNAKVEAFIATFRQQLALDAKGMMRSRYYASTQRSNS
ncbi:hypothetical protein NE237_005852 [Protea cynaroides]|uniref:Uncharacterized protein n=1 Tax=Protea cynaroides TaxID=273540 RepID=A0A9Q0KL53_9MAGN|nr:hypothetical protein NE237_005852 [Protea cynaroides]